MAIERPPKVFRKHDNPLGQEPQQEIVIQRLVTIGTVKADKYGEDPMVVAAFRLAGGYLNDRAGKDGEADSVQFTYQGVIFHASCEMPTEDQAEA